MCQEIRTVSDAFLLYREEAVEMLAAAGVTDHCYDPALEPAANRAAIARLCARVASAKSAASDND